MKLIPVLVAALAISPTVASAGRPHARISERAAQVVALKHVQGGTIKSSELEREHGKLIYSFDIARLNMAGVEEVHVDATTGRFLGQHHETALKESIERKGEAKGQTAIN